MSKLLVDFSFSLYGTQRCSTILSSKESHYASRKVLSVILPTNYKIITRERLPLAIAGGFKGGIVIPPLFWPGKVTPMPTPFLCLSRQGEFRYFYCSRQILGLFGYLTLNETKIRRVIF